MDLSIIVPVYNVEKYIEKNIKSLLQQNDVSIQYEVIIIDDESIDKSISIAEKLLSKSNIDYQIISQKNSGVSVARNHGLSLAKGKYVLFLDSDDYIEPDLISCVTKELNKGNDIIFWAYNTVDTTYSNKQCYFDIYSINDVTYNEGMQALKNILMKKKHWIWTGSAIYSRAFLYKYNLSFNSNHINGEDQEFIFSTLVYAEKVKYVPKVLSYYLIRDNSISTSFKIRKFDSTSALEKVYELLGKCNNVDLVILKSLNNYIVENYLYVYKSGLKEHNSNFMRNQLTLLDDIYPLYHEKMKKRMKEYRSNSKISNFEVYIAKKSMLIYGVVYRLIRKVKW